MSTEKKLFLVIGLLLLGFYFGHTLWPKVETQYIRTSVLEAGTVKTCLDNGGTFTARKIDGAILDDADWKTGSRLTCTYPEKVESLYVDGIYYANVTTTVPVIHRP